MSQKILYSLLVLVFFLAASPSPITATALQRVYAQTIWPTTSHALSSPFGPRLKASSGYLYDFHRGIDIPGETGVDQVYAFADGIVQSVYYEGQSGNPYPNGGTVVIIRHNSDTPIPLHGRNFTTYYSIYMHLESILIPAGAGSIGHSIAKGALVGTIGSSGTTTYPHLHFEIRVGTTCSLEYQRSHPSSACASTFGMVQDPSVNPLLFLPYPDSNSLTISQISTNPLQIRISGDKQELDFNRITYSSAAGSKVVDFNNKIGIDLSNIDNPTFGGITISPDRFSIRSEMYNIDFQVANGIYDKVTVEDIWGNQRQLNIGSNNTVPGDLSGDGHVNMVDYSRLIAGWGNPYDYNDFTALLANYGK